MVWIWKNGEANLGDKQGTRQPFVYEMGEQERMFIFYLHKETLEGNARKCLGLPSWNLGNERGPGPHSFKGKAGSQAARPSGENQNSAPDL